MIRNSLFIILCILCLSFAGTSGSSKEDRYLNINIFIEYVDVKLGNNKNKFIFSHFVDDIQNDILVSIKKFNFINLQYNIKSINYIKYAFICDSNLDFEKKFTDFMIKKQDDGLDNSLIGISLANNDSLNLFYCFSIDDNIAGVSSHPSLLPGNFIFISGICERQFITYTHELGHYFGLYHTFDENGDMCGDTSDKKVPMCFLGTSKDPNEFNIMSYSRLDQDIEKMKFTEDQKEIIIKNAKIILKQIENQNVNLKIDIDNISKLRSKLHESIELIYDNQSYK